MPYSRAEARRARAITHGKCMPRGWSPPPPADSVVCMHVCRDR